MSTGPYKTTDSTTTPPETITDDRQLLAALRRGDQAAFRALLHQYHNAMLRLALIYLSNRSSAEDVVQEAWLGVIKGLPRFEGRATLKTWIFSILINTAKTRAQQERRAIPFSALWDPNEHSAEPAVDPPRFRPAGDPWAGGWTSFPRHWDEIPEDELLSREAAELILRTIERLEPSQREVITLRDVEGWSSEEVCNVLGIRETNQRVLLHRARSKARRALEEYFDEAGLSRPTNKS